MKYSLIFWIAILFGLTGCQEAEIESKEEVVRPVKYLVLSDHNAAIQREFPGVLQAANRADLSFQVSGKLVKLPIKEGLEVKKGTLIGQLDQRDYQAKYDSAIAEFKNAKADLNRAKKLIEKEFISQSDYDKLKANAEMADANVRVSKKALQDTLLKAPFSGTIAKQYVQNFTDIQAKQAIVSLQNNDDLEIIVSIPEYIMMNKTKVEAGKGLKIYAVITGIPGEKFELTLNEFTTEADSATRTYKVTLSLVDKKGFNLFPGMTANVFAMQDLLDSIHLLPVQAVFSDPAGGEEQFVWLIDEHNKVHRQAVEIGQLKGDQIEIISGIQQNDKIVAAGVHHLTENQQIKLLSSNSL